MNNENETGPSNKTGRKLKDWVESTFETFLWNFRLVIILGVIGLLVGSTIVFLLGILEVLALAVTFGKHVFSHGWHFDTAIYNLVILTVIKTVDDFLLGIVLMIFGLGIYDLFVSRIDPAIEQTDIRPDWLVFSSLEELKGVLGKVVMMILVINFLNHVVILSSGDDRGQIAAVLQEKHDPADQTSESKHEHTTHAASAYDENSPEMRVAKAKADWYTSLKIFFLGAGIACIGFALNQPCRPRHQQHRIIG